MARGRPPEVFASRLTQMGRNRLNALLRRARGSSPVTWRRALVVRMSREGRAPREIAMALGAKVGWVREVIHAFNRDGFPSLEPKWAGGRPRRITEAMRSEIDRVASTRPQLLGQPFTRWSLGKLRSYLIKQSIVPEISRERLREILAEEKVSIQRTKSWKRSPDPDFEAKAARVIELYETLPGAVVCFDEYGPSSPIPKPGWGWATESTPQRLPANYRKPHGVRFFFGGYDVGADQLFGRWFANKGAANTLAFLKRVRRRYPAETRISLIMDNLSAHWTDEIVSWAAGHNLELVPTPTYASWLNRIEAEFGVMTTFVIANSDYKTHKEIHTATSAYLRWRNRDARQNFAARQEEKAKRRERRAKQKARRRALQAKQAKQAA